MAYLIAVENDFKIYEILPHHLLVKYGWNVVGDMMNYTHVWMRSKYNKEIIQQIKRKILYEFNVYQYLVLKYESDMRTKLNMLDFPNNLGI